MEFATQSFKPLNGPGGRGRKRIWVNKDNAPLLDIKKILRPVVSAAKAGNTGQMDSKIVPLVVHPIAPNDRDLFVLAFEVNDVQFRSQDIDLNTDGGRVRFNFKIPVELAEVHDAIDEVSLRHMCSAKPGAHLGPVRYFFSWELLSQTPPVVFKRVLRGYAGQYVEYPKDGDSIKVR